MPGRRDHDRRLLQFARQMRRDPTDAERRLWSILRKKQLAEFRFRRQYPVAGYILDFYCVRAGLAVEADGGQHAGEKGMDYDARRTKALATHGVRVIRFSDIDILKSPDVVAEAIYAELTSGGDQQG